MKEKKRRNRKPTGPRTNLIGQRFGRLVVSKLHGRKVYPSGDSKWEWECLCDCGNVVTPTGNALTTGNTTSCRKCIWADLVGQKFGKLTVVERVSEVKPRADGSIPVTWKCLCDCGNTHTVSSGNLKAGNVKSCGCLFQEVQEEDYRARSLDFLKRANEIHLGKFQYRMETFVNTEEQISIICPKHGEFHQRVADHLVSKYGCYECFRESRCVTLEEFLERSLLSHGDKYDYSRVSLTGVHNQVEIICPTHGVFRQIAKSHYEGRGCFQCMLETQSWNYLHRCRLDPEFAKRGGNLYLMRLSKDGETFLKVGVSVDILNRMACYRKEGVEVEILYLLPMLAEESGKEEVALLRRAEEKGYRYLPTTRFGGRSECIGLEHEEVILGWFKELEEEYRREDGEDNRSC